MFCDAEGAPIDKRIYFRFQVEGMAHVNLYVQAHSEVVLILLAEPGLQNDKECIKALVRRITLLLWSYYPGPRGFLSP